MCFNMVTRNSESNRNRFPYGLMTFRFEISHARTLTGQYHVTLMLLHVTIYKLTRFCLLGCVFFTFIPRLVLGGVCSFTLEFIYSLLVTTKSQPY